MIERLTSSLSASRKLSQNAAHAVGEAILRGGGAPGGRPPSGGGGAETFEASRPMVRETTAAPEIIGFHDNPPGSGAPSAYIAPRRDGVPDGDVGPGALIRAHWADEAQTCALTVICIIDREIAERERRAGIEPMIARDPKAAGGAMRARLAHTIKSVLGSEQCDALSSVQGEAAARCDAYARCGAV